MANFLSSKITKICFLHSSSSVRTFETSKFFIDRIKFDKIKYDDSLYHSSSFSILNLIRNYSVYWSTFHIQSIYHQKTQEQNENIELKDEFEMVYNLLSKNENQIINEIDSTQGVKVNLEGYYNTNNDITEKIMRPSHSFNEIIDNI